MKYIKLLRLTLTDFKGISSLALDFSGKSAAIYGNNAVGKTTIYDAWLWLLTGKDSLGRVAADNGGFDIKPLDASGTVLDRSARSVVEAVISTGDRNVTLRREYYEKWTTKRGSAEASYDGNSTDYYIDDVPKNKRQYDEEVSAIISQETFRLLSDVTAFAKLDDKSRREILFQIAGLGDERTIMETDERFSDLYAATEIVSLADYQKKIKAQRTKLNDQRRDIPARLDEIKKQEADLSVIPFEALRQSAVELEAEKAQLESGLNQTREDRTASIRVEIGDLQNQRTALILKNDAHRAKQQRSVPDTGAIRQEITRLELAYKCDSDRYHGAKRDIDRYEAKLEAARAQWLEIKREPYPGNAICPTCGQTLPPEKQAEVKEVWHAHQKRRMDLAAEEGERYKKLVRTTGEQRDGYQEQMIRRENEIAKAKDELAALEAQPVVEVQDMDGFKEQMDELDKQLESRRTAIKDAQESEYTYTSEIRGKINAVAAELKAVREQLAKEDTLCWLTQRKKALNDQTREISQQIADTDRALDLVEEFTRYKAKYVTGTINDLFRLTQFRLFRNQVNGGLVDCCDIMCGGVPYNTGLNSGARINVGLDIIETLSRHYNCLVPIFIDNAESVTELKIPQGAQIVRLVVSAADEKVRFEQE